MPKNNFEMPAGMIRGGGRGALVWLLLIGAIAAAELAPAADAGTAPGAGGGVSGEETTTDSLTISTYLEKREMLVGDQAFYRVKLKWDSTLTDTPRVNLLPEGSKFEFERLHEAELKNLDAFRRSRDLSFKIFAFEEGELQTPVFQISYQLKSTGEQKVFRTPPQTVQVRLVPPDQPDQPDIRPIAGVQAPPAPPFPWLTAGVAAGALLLGLLAAYWLLRRYRRRGRPTLSAPPIPIEELAYRELLALENSDLLNRELFRHYFEELSRILRAYLGARFEFPALDLTSFEIQQALKRRIAVEVLQRLDAINGHSDLVKFARWLPPKTIARQALDEARRIVEATTPTALEQLHAEHQPAAEESAAARREVA